MLNRASSTSLASNKKKIRIISCPLDGKLKTIEDGNKFVLEKGVTYKPKTTNAEQQQQQQQQQHQLETFFDRFEARAARAAKREEQYDQKFLAAVAAKKAKHFEPSATRIELCVSKSKRVEEKKRREERKKKNKGNNNKKCEDEKHENSSESSESESSNCSDNEDRVGSESKRTRHQKQKQKQTQKQNKENENEKKKGRTKKTDLSKTKKLKQEHGKVKISRVDGKTCLTMVFRREARVILRALTSCINMIDCYMMCDTRERGEADDGTTDIIKTFMAENGIPGEVYRKPWKNFGYNKTHVLRRTQSNAITKDSRYIMFIDADEVFVENAQDVEAYPTRATWDRLRTLMNSMPHYNVFMLRTHFGELRYWRWNIVRNNIHWKWAMPVQEHLVADTKKDGSNNRSSSSNIVMSFYVTDPGIINIARKQGNSSHNPERKWRDIEMLHQWLNKHKNEPRGQYYIADAYGNAGNRACAVYYFLLRVQNLTGNVEERLQSLLRLARITERNELIVKYLHAAIVGWPHRAEPYAAFDDVLQ